MENNKSGNNFFSGFLLGALVGAAVVFLLATKKGKKILKAISEEGSENLSSILSKLDKAVDLEDSALDDEDDTFTEVTVSKRSSDDNSTPAIKEKPRATKRFFRGISKRVN